MHLKGFDETAWKELRRNARVAAHRSLSGRIVATDLSPKAIAAARKNAATAGVDQLISFACAISRKPRCRMGNGVVVLNPEYGERLGKSASSEVTYRGIGDFFKQRCVGYQGYIFTGNLELAKKVGLKATAGYLLQQQNRMPPAGVLALRRKSPERHRNKGSPQKTGSRPPRLRRHHRSLQQPHRSWLRAR